MKRQEYLRRIGRIHWMFSSDNGVIDGRVMGGFGVECIPDVICACWLKNEMLKWSERVYLIWLRVLNLSFSPPFSWRKPIVFVSFHLQKVSRFPFAGCWTEKWKFFHRRGKQKATKTQKLTWHVKITFRIFRFSSMRASTRCEKCLTLWGGFALKAGRTSSGDEVSACE